MIECFKTIVLRTMWTVWTQFKRLQKVKISAAGVDAILKILLAQKNMADICLWSKSMLEVKLKNLGLRLVEEISK